MMKYYFQVIIIIFNISVLYQGCAGDKNPVKSQAYKIYQGSWEGKLDSNYFLITFIEGTFEDSPTLTGSVFLGSDSQAISYLIMGGTHNRKDSLWFALYKTPINGKEQFHLKGSINYNKISGVFNQFGDKIKIINKGDWQVKRVP